MVGKHPSENGHFNVKCENKRMVEIYKDLKYKPVVFIRMNPDIFEGTSCFVFDEKNKISCTSAWETRKIILRDTIQKHLDNVPTKSITSEYLFYSQKQIDHVTKSNENNSDSEYDSDYEFDIESEKNNNKDDC